MTRVQAPHLDSELKTVFLAMDLLYIGHYQIFQSTNSHQDYMNQFPNTEQQRHLLPHAAAQTAPFAPTYTSNPPTAGSVPAVTHRSGSTAREPHTQQYQQPVHSSYNQSVAATQQTSYIYAQTPASVSVPTTSVQYSTTYSSYVSPVFVDSDGCALLRKTCSRDDFL